MEDYKIFTKNLGKVFGLGPWTKILGLTGKGFFNLGTLIKKVPNPNRGKISPGKNPHFPIKI